MENTFWISSGTALIAGSLLMVVTMVLHPAGGSLEHLLKSSSMIIAAHSIGIVSIPVIIFGFWGLTRFFKATPVLSHLAFSFFTVGALAGVCAAVVNGLALPLFIKNYSSATPEIKNTISPILRYNFALNHAFDLVLIVTICIAILLWSVAALKEKSLPRWIGYGGVVISGSAIVILLTGFSLVDLRGFRLFIFSIVGWIVAMGFLLKDHRTA